MKKNIIYLLLTAFVCFSIFYFYINLKTDTTPNCKGIKKIYNWYWANIQSCTQDNDIYFKVTSFWFEWWSGDYFFNTKWDLVWSREQYAQGGWGVDAFWFPQSAYNRTQRMDPEIKKGKIYTWSCVSIDLQNTCGIIDLVSSYRGATWLLIESEYAKTCKIAQQKMGLRLNDEWLSMHELVWRHFMCTDDTSIFYIWFTGNKIEKSFSAPYQNYDTIQFFNLLGEQLWVSTKFKLKVNGDQLHEIDIKKSSGKTYDINRCTPIPIYDCYR